MNKYIPITATLVGFIALIVGTCLIFLAIRKNEKNLILQIDYLKEELAENARLNNETFHKLDEILKNQAALHEALTLNVNSISQIQTQVWKNTPSSCIGKLSEIYNVKLPGADPFLVPCEFSSSLGSGWTVVQRRMDGSVNFNRDWSEYVNGFGNFSSEFFLGLEKLHQLTKSQPHELHIYLMDFENVTQTARYSEFEIGNEKELYELKLLKANLLDAEDAFISLKNMKFSTPDMDNDEDKENCAEKLQSGWWFKTCSSDCNLNGVYTKVETNENNEGIIWKNKKPLKFTQMMIRPVMT